MYKLFSMRHGSDAKWPLQAGGSLTDSDYTRVSSNLYEKVRERSCASVSKRTKPINLWMHTYIISTILFSMGKRLPDSGQTR